MPIGMMRGRRSRPASWNGLRYAAVLLIVLLISIDCTNRDHVKFVAATVSGLRSRSSMNSRGSKVGAEATAAIYPLKRGNGGEPPGLIPTNHLIPTEESSYVMDLHPLKRGSGSAGGGTPCGLTSRVLGDLYGSRRLNLVSDAGSETAPPLSDSPAGVEGQDCIGEDQQLRDGDRGSGLVWLLGDPARVPPAPTEKP